MKPKRKPKHEGPLSIPMDFDEAIKRVLTVKPPPEGWAAHERRSRQQAEKRTPRPKKG